jgi:hypothetical protein
MDLGSGDKMSLRTTVGNIIDNSLPATPIYGPPLPIGLKVQWPYMWEYKVPRPIGKIVSGISNPMVDAKHS